MEKTLSEETLAAVITVVNKKQRLPDELVQLVLNYLFPDDMYSCILVNRQWSRIALPKLYLDLGKMQLPFSRLQKLVSAIHQKKGHRGAELIKEISFPNIKNAYCSSVVIKKGRKIYSR